MQPLSSELAHLLILVLVAPTYLPSVAALSSDSSITAITPDQPLLKGTVLVSPKGDFKLCFFSKSHGKFMDAIVWVANRQKALPTTASAVLKVPAEHGSSAAIVLVDNKTGDVFWSSADSNSHITSSSGPTADFKKVSARLEDSGNLVLLDASFSTMWQSFDHPTDTLLAGMKIGWDSRTSQRWYLSSWKSADDPSPGSYNYSLEPAGEVPQLFIRGPGGTPTAYMGYYNGQTFSGMLQIRTMEVMWLEYYADIYQTYYIVHPTSASVKLSLVLDNLGIIRQYVYIDKENGTRMLYKWPFSICEKYVPCGPNGVCDGMLQTSCDCIKGYGPGRGGSGCTRTSAFHCRQDDVFEKMTGIKLPDMTNATVNTSMTPKQCEDTCLVNCYCVAYAIASVASVDMCIMWDGKLLDVQQFTGGGGNDLFVRSSANCSGTA